MIYRYTRENFVFYTDPDATSYFKVVLSPNETYAAVLSMVEFMRACGRDVSLVERLPEAAEVDE